MIPNSTEIHIKGIFRDHKVKEQCQFLFQIYLMFSGPIRIYHSAPFAIGSPWTFDSRSVQWLCFELFYATSVYSLHPGWGSCVLQTIFAPVQFTFTNILGDTLLSLCSNSSVELCLDEGELCPHLQGIWPLIRAWPIEANLEVTLSKVLISVYGRLCLLSVSFCLPSDKALFTKMHTPSIVPFKDAPWV